MARETQDTDQTREQLLAEIAQLKERIAELKTTKSIEKIFDTTYFQMRLEDEVARCTRYKHEFSLLFTEMDNLDTYAAKYDKESAAELVDMLNTIMRDAFRKTDIYCQFAAGRYGIILPHTRIEGALVAAEKLKQRVERVFRLTSQSFKIQLTMSIGAVTYPKDAVSYDNLLQAAAESLEKAKAKGGNYVWSAAVKTNQESEERAREVLSHNALLSKALDEEVLRCSRYGQKFSLMIITPGGAAVEKATHDYELRTVIMQNTYKMIEMTIRNIDRNYFYTGNRFAIMLPNTDSQNARIVGQKLVAKLTENPLTSHHGVDITITLSIGIGCFPIDDVSKEGLIRRVETALDCAVKNGRNQIVLVSDIAAAGKEHHELNELVASLKEAGPDGLYNLLAVVDLTENYSKPHSQAVARYALAIGQAMRLSGIDKNKLRIAALLHDLGKILLPEKIITKPGPLTQKEWVYIRKHPTYGAAILERLPGFAACSLAVMAHHERWDGKGYPGGLKGKQIPFESQVIAVAEAYDDMTTPRPYRQRLPANLAIEELKKNAGTQFNPDIVRIFAGIIGKVEQSHTT